MNSRTYLLYLFSLLWLLGPELAAQQRVEERLLMSDPHDLLEMKQDEHLRTATNDLPSRDVREAPANIQIITSRQIEASGARDLFEVLQLVPGISFAGGPNDAIGLGIHGLWAHEGKWVLLLNGERLNENDLGTYSISQRIPVENIDRIEVILGPGAIVHQDQALLGVINILTRAADQGSYSQATLRTGHAHGQLSSTSMSMTGAYRIGKDQEVSFMTSTSRGSLSNYKGVQPNGDPISFADSTGSRSAIFQFHYRWKGLKAFMMFMDENQQVSDASYNIGSRDVIVGLKQHLNLGKRTELSWKVKMGEQTPNNYLNTSNSMAIASNTMNQRYSGIIMFGYKPTDWFSSRIGVNGYHQSTRYTTRDIPSSILDHTRQMELKSIGAFAELSLQYKNSGSLTGGWKGEYNEILGRAMAPRLAYTKVVGRFHGKFMHSKAFRLPALMNHQWSHTNGGMLPEFSTTTGSEIGARVNSNTLITINIHRTELTRPITRVALDPGDISYVNGPTLGTQGMDVKINWQSEALLVSMGAGINEVLQYVEEGNNASVRRAHPGMPQHRGTLMCGWKATPSFTLRTRGNWRGNLYTMVPQEDGEQPMEWDDELVINAGIIWRPGSSVRSIIDLGMNNLLNIERRIITPTAEDQFPLMLNGREFTFTFIYKFLN